MTPTDTANPIDLLVIGGGINGAGVARDAAGRGLNVILCEKDDLAQGTSSRSGKYIHGGLRYLEYYEFRLVREALIEREVVLQVAPHLGWPLRLILPHSPEQRPRWLIRLGLFLYDNLGGRKRVPGTRAVNLTRAPEGQIVNAQFKNAFAYWDVWIDDARLVVLNAVDAARRGAEVLTRTTCTSARRDGGLWHATLRDSRTGATRNITARAIVNTAGPWVEQVLGNVAGVNSQRRVRLVKGSHIITKRWWQGDHGYVLQAPDKRLIFVNPYFDDLALIGTTDIPFSDRPEDVQIAPEETDYLLTILNRYFTTQLTPDDVLHSYSGVRPLFDDDESKGASAVTRDYTFELDGGGDRAPILSAFGGKLTTYRKLSEHALQKLVPFFPAMAKDWTATAPLPGGDVPGADFDSWFKGFAADHPWLPDPLARHYARCYGTDAPKLLAGAKALPDLGQHFGALFYEVEADWLIQNEWAETADDILTRRTKHGIFLTKAQIAAFDQWLQQAAAA
ncbi:glycerol-3-phosphate dehydrogenase [Actibacterium sp. 188UL27-1]|uniref:glycerol-3-phosphate dehydrogenase n=1 Tax=Actibacterium sp. 188UL27-1 TaxID=2786961 RepID=UPI00195AFC67|nr:glycerol-3-phosphate dehydrogenase [Actibacterium sp. 188UL27-1]MBM7069400.1 glycerol-3-phosphate dehydrogenase [Actibacterium sp. 188UL27-1]